MRKITLAVFCLLVGVAAFINYSNGRHEAPLPFSQPVSLQPNIYDDLEGYQDIVELQNAFIRNAKQLKPTVVSINELWKCLPAKRKLRKGIGWLVIQFQDWLSDSLKKKYLVESLGSGVIYDSRGYILTNYHVVENVDEIMVKLMDQREFSAKVVGVDPLTDLAVLKIFSFSSFPVPTFGSTKTWEWANGSWPLETLMDWTAP